MASTYDALADYLARQDGQQCRLTVAQIEHIIQQRLYYSCSCARMSRCAERGGGR